MKFVEMVIWQYAGDELIFPVENGKIMERNRDKVTNKYSLPMD